MIKGTESVGRIKIEKLLARRDYNDLKSYYGKKISHNIIAGFTILFT